MSDMWGAGRGAHGDYIGGGNTLISEIRAMNGDYRDGWFFRWRVFVLVMIVCAALACSIWGEGSLSSVASVCSAAEPQPPAPRPRSEVERILSRESVSPRADLARRPLTVVLVADRKDHGPNEHDYPHWQKRWALLLGGSSASSEKAANLFGPDLPHPLIARGAANVRVVSVSPWLESAHWEGADLAVIFAYVTWTPNRIEEVRRHLERGRGLVVIHSATWTKPEASREVADVTGVGGFQQWRHGWMTLEITKPEHPVCQGLPPSIRLLDEAYWPPTPAIDPARVQVLAVSRERTSPTQAGDSPQPMFWTWERGRGRVFGCVLGHYSWTFDDPYFRLLLLRGMAWAANEDPGRFEELVLRSACVSND